jgi:hypothetical protein
MTPDILVNEIVATLAPNGDLVRSTDIDAYCDTHGIQRQDDSPGAPNNNIYWACDLMEAGSQHRLLKFKTDATRNAPNLFALRLDHPKGPAPAGSHVGRQKARRESYVECIWNGTKWEWKTAKVPPA